MPGSDDALAVRYGDRTVGRLRQNPNDLLSFEYDSEWIALDTAFPISLSLPLSAAPTVGGAAHAFFANLLPEGSARQAVCNRLGISEDNDFALLRAIGGECAGALTVVDPATGDRDVSDHRYEQLEDRRLRSLVSDEQVVPLLVGGSSTRLSLAGAQNKVPVALLEGKLYLPLERSLSTDILKLPHHRFAHIAVNEAYVTGLARRLGFEVVNAELFNVTDPPSLLVERYDRPASDDPWPVRRLHQEDLCQALGLPPSRKYEQEGGPTLAAAIEIVRAHVLRPVFDVGRLLEWQAFNVTVGNSDGHAKNLSILYQDAGIRLAPFYDLLSTRHYPGLDRKMAMSVGGVRDPDLLRREQWASLATQLQISARVATDLALGVAERCLDAVRPWTREFHERHGKQPILQTLPQAIARRARRVVRALSR